MPEPAVAGAAVAGPAAPGAVRLFLSDLDGCLAEPYRPYDLAALGEVAALVGAAGAVGETGRPPFTLLTGRAYAYAEAFAQLLATRAPVFFEAGAGAFVREEGRVVWHPAVAEADAALGRVRDWLVRRYLPGRPTVAFDYGKRAQAGVVSLDPDALGHAVDALRRFVADEAAGLVVFTTNVSADVVPRGLTKGDTLAWIAEVTGVPVSAMAYVGDTEGDLGALRTVPFSYAPANADPAVRAAVGHVTDAPGVRGVIEAYRHACRIGSDAG